MYPTLTQTIEINQIGDITKAPIIYGQTESEGCPQEPKPFQSIQQDQAKIEVQQDKVVKKSNFPLVHYSSDSEDEIGVEPDRKDTQNRDLGYKIPPDETKLIIDKMASYVAKNGRDFEAIVRSKGDARFEFLNEEHEYHSYYKVKIKECGGDVQTSVMKEQPKTVQNGVQSMQDGPKDVQTQQQQAKLKDKKIISKLFNFVRLFYKKKINICSSC